MDTSRARVRGEEIMLLYKVLQMLCNMARSVVSLLLVLNTTVNKRA